MTRNVSVSNISGSTFNSSKFSGHKDPSWTRVTIAYGKQWWGRLTASRPSNS